MYIPGDSHCRTGTSARPNMQIFRYKYEEPYGLRRSARTILAIWISILWTSLSIAQESSPSKLEGYDLTFPAMGSTITLSAYSDSEAKVEQAFNAVQLEIDRLVAILSDYEPDSELNRMHREATTPQPVSNELYEVLLASEQWHVRSKGAFDAAIGKLTRLWREARKRREVPSKQEIDEAILHTGWNKIRLNPKDRTLMLLDPDVRIDLGGIAAGYIVDRAFDILLSHGLPHALVNDGGDIRVGEPPPGRVTFGNLSKSMVSVEAIFSIQKRGTVLWGQRWLR
jgi:FAD:protein FMN transferase